MNDSNQVLSNIVVYNKYAKYDPELKRREDWEEIVDRYVDMMIKRYAQPKSYAAWNQGIVGEHSKMNDPIYKEILENCISLYEKTVLMSMRAAQFAGPATEKNETRVFNCSFLPVDNPDAFSEIMFLLLGGTGVGYSVQFNDIEKLPDISKPIKEYKFLIGDSIEGWADAIKVLMESYFGMRATKPKFDFSDIRPKGSLLITAGGKAPGPAPLKECLFKIEQILESKTQGDKLTSLEVHDIICHIANAVLAGGIRRAALIALFSVDDDAMRTCKHGAWWELNPQRGRANNSGVFVRGRSTKEHFERYFQQVKESEAGEPGIYFTNDPAYGANPCCEISLRPFTFCNLTEINGGSLIQDHEMVPLMDDEDWEEVRLEFFKRCKIAAFWGTLQAGFTNYHYLRPVWRRNSEKDSLIGVGITGICNGDLLLLREKYPDILKQGAQIVKEENERVATIIGIATAARCTTIKPSGTTSCVLGTSSGIHAWHSRYYIRNMQCAVGSDLYDYFVRKHPQLIKIMDYDSQSAVIGIPQKAPTTAILRDDETAAQFLERVRIFNEEWVKEGHRRGPNTNNVSATISVKEEEWEVVRDWMWENKHTFNGLSVLPFDGGSYRDAPFETCTQEEYEAKLVYVKDITSLSGILEDQDNTDLKGEVACGGGACEIRH
jgi:ribonucleoside-triphosphate reductase